MKKMFGSLMAMCFLTASLTALAQSGDAMKQDSMKHDDMKQEQMKKDDMKKDKKSTKTKKDKGKKNDMKKDDSMKHERQHEAELARTCVPLAGLPGSLVRAVSSATRRLQGKTHP